MSVPAAVRRHLTFDDLPAELVQQIASIGSCEAALALVQVSRYVRHACNTRHVFKSILERQNDCGRLEWCSVALSTDAPTSSWTRYTMADYKARRRIAGDFPCFDRLKEDRFLDWAPQLMAAGRKNPSFI